MLEQDKKSGSAGPPRAASPPKQRTKESLQETEFQLINNRWNARTGQENLREINETDWTEYHRLYKAACEKWGFSPAQVVAEFLCKVEDESIERRIADFGCGECLLEACIKARGDRTHLKVTSYDLRATPEVKKQHDVTIVNLAGPALKAPAKLYHHVVCCLSLMGTDMSKILVNARRVVDPDKGQIIIVETRSHMPSPSDVKQFMANVTECGFNIAEEIRITQHVGPMFIAFRGLVTQSKSTSDFSFPKPSSLKPATAAAAPAAAGAGAGHKS